MSNYPFWLGGVAASMAACCTHPLDLTKVRMQTLPQSLASKSPSTIAILRHSIAESGVRSLYTGLTASLLRQMSYSLVRLGSYEEIKYALSSDGPPSTTKLLAAAALAGGLGGIAGNPADILLVRMTSDSIRPPEKRYGYRNAFEGLVRLVKDEGIPGLTRGLVPNVASQVGSYDFFKLMLLSYPLPLSNYQMRDNLLCHFTASTLAGTVATTICSPADVLKSRLMSLSGNVNPVQVVRDSLRTEGPGFLFKGWTPAFIRLVPNTILMFVFFEQLKKQWRLLTAS
ncbi:mitochondrial carrier [Neolentinus lepideus HHB14362 ss-1]|uniref:Mitochondrial carrier n=1 Tax=Neolentinus lepideus HHB14362 ss-1 TaxID=1314782 RepID=A0A165Q9A2_9AGAM|nr:mitochondrial carrier [Neolentinus lepideus HHB14362 ss-1]